jgi:hypothetical protein
VGSPFVLRAELPEDASLQWLGEEVSKHVSWGVVFDSDFTGGDRVGNKEVSDVDVSRVFAA